MGKELFTVQGEYSANMIREKILGQTLDVAASAQVPARPRSSVPDVPHRSVFSVLNKLKIHATGDIGCYTPGRGGTSGRHRHHHLHGSQHQHPFTAWKRPRAGISSATGWP